MLRVSENSIALAPSVNARWDQVTAVEWNRLLELSKSSNLLQSWAYGQAKSKTEGWGVTRCVFYRGNEPVALAQALFKSFGLIKIYRINRGPVFISQFELDSLLVKQVYCELSKRFRFWKGTFLLLAPTLEINTSERGLLRSCGFRQTRRHGFHSARIDLKRSEQELRQSLRGNWRNQLKSAEKSELIIESGDQQELLNWLISENERDMRDKNFRGITGELIRQIAQNKIPGNELTVFRASQKNPETQEIKPVAGVLIARHGAGATYLVGFNSAEGRKLNAINLLLWQSLLALKNEGLFWFDVGGMDELKTPHITKFKRGLNGIEYRLENEAFR